MKTTALRSRITLNLVIGIIAMTVCVVTMLLWFVAEHNRDAAVSSRRMVAGALEARGQQAAALLREYAWNAQPLLMTPAALNRWAGDIARSAFSTGAADLMVLAPMDREPLALRRTEDGELRAVRTPPAFTRNAHVLLDQLRSGNENVRVTFANFDNEGFLIAMGYMGNVDSPTTHHEKPLVMAIGISMEGAKLAALGRSFLLDELQLVPPSKAPPGAEILTGVDGRPFGALSWTIPRPGDRLLARSLIPVFLALALSVAISGFAAMRADGIANAMAQREAEAYRVARHDSLTGLPNRLALSEYSSRHDAAAAARDGRLDVLHVDLKDFKRVNDTAGTAGGDQVLRAVVARIADILPADGFFSRIGGDEFVICLPRRGPGSQALEIAKEIREALARPIEAGGFEFRLTAATGIARATWPPVSADELLRRADVATFHAKRRGTSEAVVYSASMEIGAVEKKRMETALRLAIKEGSIEILYQPVINTTALTIDYVEALARWKCPVNGNVPPDRFVPVAEETGLIHDFTLHVLERVCNDAAPRPNLRVSVNISPLQLRDAGFPAKAAGIIERFGIEASRIELEITENVLIDNRETAQNVLNDLHDRGFSLSIDDFGTGYSSLGYLRAFPFDKMKLDQSFVRHTKEDSAAAELLRAMVMLGEAIDLPVVAEGVETFEQFEILRKARCRYLQGYFFSRPIGVLDLDRMIRRWPQASGRSAKEREEFFQQWPIAS